MLAMALGAPGIFLVAFLDSSILSLPEVADLLVIWMVTYNRSRIVIYVVSATLGSLLGCLLLYGIGKKGGAAFVHRRFGSTNVDRTLAAFRRHGMMAVLIPSILPPPAPFKIFVLLAGVAGIPIWQFVTAVAVARGIRYFGEGLLAMWYGDRAITFLHAHAVEIGLWLAGTALAGGAAWIAWQRRKRV
jgi:membrane protein YqaA with SNARE-associated domain